jgi:AAA domain
MKYHQVDASEINNRLFYCAHKGEKLFKPGLRYAVVPGHLADMIRNSIKQHNIKVLVVEPFVKAHELDENSNVLMDLVIDTFAALAEELGVAIMLAHHTRKGSNEAGNADIGRGATSVKNGARLVYTTTRMSDAERQIFGLNEKDALATIRLDSAEVNLCPATRATWFKLIGVKLENPTDLYPHGDEIQAIESWTPPDLLAGLTTTATSSSTKSRPAWRAANGIPTLPTRPSEQHGELFTSIARTKPKNNAARLSKHGLTIAYS